jgi:hypothetical protein
MFTAVAVRLQALCRQAPGHSAGDIPKEKFMSRPQLRPILLLSFFLVAGLLAGCGNSNRTVTVTYQHLANCPSFSLGNKSGSIPGGMFQVFMLRGIVNQEANAQNFTFSLQKVNEDNVKPGAGGGAFDIMTQSSVPLFLPVDFSVQVGKGQAYTVPIGQGVLFAVGNDGAEATTTTFLNYKSSGSESVLMSMLDSKFAPLVCPDGVLNDDFLNTIHSKQNDFENNYTPDGAKK